MNAPDLIKKFSLYIDATNIMLGRCLSWLTFVMALVVLGLVLGRNVFNAGSIAVQESVIYMHAAVFLLCMAYTAQANGHVRVDIFYRRLNCYQRAWVDITGNILFLMPFAIFLVIISWHYALKSWGWQPSSGEWGVKEGSGNTGGIEAIFLLKSLIPIAGILLFLHALSNTLENLLTLCVGDDDTGASTAERPVKSGTDLSSSTHAQNVDTTT